MGTESTQVRYQAIVGLIGGIASGKSLIASLLQDRGAAVVDADRLAHQALQDPLVLQGIVDRFGPSILGHDGKIDRSALGRLVFGVTPESRSNLEDLEAKIHPRVLELGLAEIAQHRVTKKHPVIVLDAPLLLEAKWDAHCDAIVFVDTPLELRQEWAKRRGWDGEELARREANQMPLNAKAAAADFLIHNSQDWESVSRQVDVLWERLLSIQANGSHS